MTTASTRDRDEACPICGAGVARFVFEKNRQRVERCDGCGVGRAIATDFDPESYYTGDYFEGGREDGYADYGESAAVLAEEFARAVERLRGVAPTGGALLEIGCAYGFFLKAAAPFWRVHGLEISADAVARCQAAGLDKVRQGVASREALAAVEPAQAIVMLDVIEHLPNPVEVLELCRDKLLPGGVLMLTTGDFGSPLARLLGRRWRLMTPPQHLWYFTVAGFRALARRQGWEVVEIDHPGKRVPLSLIVYQLRRMLGLAPRASTRWADVGVPVNLFDAMRVTLRRPAAKAVAS